jgi:4-carboxymuconolactone decarboxylase
MSNTSPAEHTKRRQAGVLAIALGLAAPMAQESQGMPRTQTTAPSTSETLTDRQQAVVPIAAFAAAGNIAKLNAALNQGLDAGLTVSDANEVLVQLYAYAGFPRSLNALGELMKVVEARKQRGIQDAPGREPSRAIPTGDGLLAAGTANQTKISGAPVKGPLFDFNQFLQAHLFGAIFERDNLDWQSRELATVGMPSALPGAESQLRSHMAASMRVGLTAGQLRHLTQVLADRVDAEHARRAVRLTRTAHETRVCTSVFFARTYCSARRPNAGLLPLKPRT